MSALSASATPPAREPLNQRAARSLRHPLTGTLLVLTFTTGLVDAVSYLGIGRVFTANMTGNVVLLGFGIAGSAGLPVVAPLISLGAFLLGAGAGGKLAVRLFGGSGTGTARRTSAVLAMLAGGLAGALLLKTSVVLPLAVAAAVAFVAAVAYPGVARAEASRVAR